MELMLTLAVAAVILAFATPSFREFRRNSEMASASNDLLASLQQARSEAIKRQRIVSLCASDAPFANPPVCSAAFGGWVVWVDDDPDAADNPPTDGNGRIDAGEAIISQHAALDDSLGLSSDSAVVSYAPSGFARGSVGGVRAARVALICDDRLDTVAGSDYRKRVLSISATGRASVMKAVAAVDALQESLDEEEIVFDFSCAQGGES